jgi:hypothetical protein
VRVRPIHSSASPAGTTATQILVAEVSAVVDTEDVRRAATRARLLQRATGVAALAVVAGGRILGAAAQDAQAVGVRVSVDREHVDRSIVNAKIGAS